MILGVSLLRNSKGAKLLYSRASVSLMMPHHAPFLALGGHGDWNKIACT